MHSSYVEFISNTHEAFGPNDSASQRWETANMLVRRLGGTALNIGAIHIDRTEPKWMLSSMSPAWLYRYVNEDLYKIDPFIPLLQNRNAPIELDTTIRKHTQPLNPYLFEAGYKFLYGLPFSGSDLFERKIVTFCTDMTRAEIQARGYLRLIHILAAILATQVQPLDSSAPIKDQYFSKNTLSRREAESLALLAQGLKNQRIAEILGVAEVTVRNHINSARKKLGALTREQAIAIALQHGIIRLGITSDI